MKALYDSAWHHPFVAYVVGLWLLYEIARRLPFLYTYSVVFLVCIVADATATGGWSPVPMGTGAYTFFSVLFIILGDLRYFLLVERVTHPRDRLGRVLVWSVGMSLVMPVVTGVMTRTITIMQNDRVLYLVYEATMGVIVLSLNRYRYASSDAPPDVRRWVARVSGLFGTLYFGWALADAVLLLGIEAGHLLRIVPNVLYYGAFLPFVFLSAPATWRTLEASDARA